MRNDEDYEPGTLVEHEDSSSHFSFVFSLARTAIERADLIFVEELGDYPSGYTWDATVDALVRIHMPTIASELHYNSEGSMFCVESSDPEALKQVAQLIRNALQDFEVLKEALKNVHPQ